MIDRLSIDACYENKKRPLILDGAIGSYLQETSNLEATSMWSSLMNVSQKDKVIALHKEYINSGADIITANTFRTNPIAYKSVKIDISNQELVRHSVNLTHEARGSKKVIIAGSNAPAEDCYQIERTLSIEELVDNHKKHIQYLWDAGVDIILNETFSHLDEIEIVSQICSRKNIPFIISLYFAPELKILSGEDIYVVIDFVKKFNPTAIALNCISIETFSKIDISKLSNIKWGFYLNCGSGEVTDHNITCGINPKDYSEFIKRYLYADPLFIGSCCGSNPTHTKALKELVDEVYRD